MSTKKLRIFGPKGLRVFWTAEPSFFWINFDVIIKETANSINRNAAKIITVDIMYTSIPNYATSRMGHIPAYIEHQCSEQDHADTQEKEGKPSPQTDVIFQPFNIFCVVAL